MALQFGYAYNRVNETLFFVIVRLMKRIDFIKAVKQLGLNSSEYIVIGSGILGILDIREVNDIDLVVSKNVFQKYEQSNQWTKKHFEDGTYYLLNDLYEIGLDWDSQNAMPNLLELKNDQLVIRGIPFISLQKLKSWKLKKGREKDLIDIKLIDRYLETRKV